MEKSNIKMNKEQIKLIKSTFLDEKATKETLCRFIMNTEILSMGKQCQTFEERFAKKQKRNYAIFVSSGSSANLLLIQALLNLDRLKKGDKILVSSLTWSTNIMPLIQLGLIPVPIDCNLETLNVGIDSLKKSLVENKGIKGLFLTNVLGMCSEIDDIKKYCEEKNVLFIEDNCESLGSEYKGELLGNFGLASTFSFFVGHHISTIEGGMICTDDPVLAEHLKMIRAHGWTRQNSKELKEKLKNKHNIEEFYSKYAFYDLAYNCRPTEINGLIGNVQLRHWDFIVKRREENFNIFLAATKGNEEIVPIRLDNMNKVSNFAFPLLFKNKESFTKYKEKFIEENVEIRPIIAGNITKQPFFKKYSKEHFCPNADYIHEHGFYIPNNPEMTDKEIKRIVNLITN